jgi:hypothetical protein
MIRASKFALLAVIAGAVVAVPGAAGGARAAATLRATMNGNVEVPKGDPNGKGTARVTTSQSKGQVCYTVTLSNVGTVTSGHIHKGAKGAAGDVVVPLFDTATSQPKGCATGVKKSLIRDIEAHPGRYYINVHNATYPGGAVRGQLRR